MSNKCFELEILFNKINQLHTTQATTKNYTIQANANEILIQMQQKTVLF